MSDPRIGIVGYGKLGNPVAHAIASRGFHVTAYDINVETLNKDFPKNEERPFPSVVQVNKAETLAALASSCDIIFVAVETPHNYKYGGDRPLPSTREDFNYKPLKTALRQLVKAIPEKRDPEVVIISTVLPGTIDRIVKPWWPKRLCLTYNPSFIAMGTVANDFLNPEFVLLGADDHHNIERVITLYFKLLGKDTLIKRCTIPEAELIKVAYNTYISQKIVFANTLMEIAHAIPDCNVDVVSDTLSAATKRLISPMYLRGGMGDGGACHPRDNIALSWFAREYGLSHDLFDDIMAARENQAQWLVDYLLEFTDLPKGILGTAYKPQSNILTGSAAVLCKEMLLAAVADDPVQPTRGGRYNRTKEVPTWDPYVDGKYLKDLPDEPYAFLVGCKHPEFATWTYPVGSVILDPFRYIPDQDGVEVIRVGDR